MLKLKDKSLKYNKGNLNAAIKLSGDTLYEISWSKKIIFNSFKHVRYPKTSIKTCKDASLEDWCASMGNVSIVGAWLPDEKLICINVLELKAILLAIKSCVKTSHIHIKIMSDNDNSNPLHKQNGNITFKGMSLSSSKSLEMGNHLQKSSFSSSHSMETKQSG